MSGPRKEKNKILVVKLNYCILPWEFLLVKKLEIEKTKTAFIISVFKVVYCTGGS